ncbi:hypothetical protein HMPREF1549_02362 [Actinomyces johnsonii F0510]|uniref:Uncharacterized protein n=1 Tax=Actinomyces johnsonii F0510 TaxID=1227262 RepID=U1PN17_9ACTO|nr:hypothetical protein HMPREF1549_02362 [Actinomyces johnsonii F0510]
MRLLSCLSFGPSPILVCDLPTTSGVRCDPVEFIGARAVLSGMRRPRRCCRQRATYGYGSHRKPFRG